MIRRLPADTPATIARHIRDEGRPYATACYVNTRPRIGTYLPLARALRRAGHTALLFLAPQVAEGILPEELLADGESDGLHIGTIDLDALEKVEGVDVFFSSEAMSQSPPGSRTVRLIHSLPDGGLAIDYARRVRKRPHLARHTDYLAIPVRQTAGTWSIENYRGLVEGAPPGDLVSRRSHFDIVPAGYPKIEYLEQAIPPGAPCHYLIYCPTAPTVSHSRVLSHGLEILQALRCEFPDYEIVFRPYPSVEQRVYQEFRDLFRNLDRLVWDDTLGGITYLRHAAVAITDRSSAAVTFSLASGRPSVFFEDDGAGLREDPLGYRAGSVTQVIEAVHLSLTRRHERKEAIFAERERRLYHGGQAGAASIYLAAHVPRFAAGDTHEEWLSIPRTQLYTHSHRP